MAIAVAVFGVKAKVMPHSTGQRAGEFAHDIGQMPGKSTEYRRKCR
jgi:hypothetical protein